MKERIFNAININPGLGGIPLALNRTDYNYYIFANYSKYGKNSIKDSNFLIKTLAKNFTEEKVFNIGNNPTIIQNQLKKLKIKKLHLLAANITVEYLNKKSLYTTEEAAFDNIEKLNIIIDLAKILNPDIILLDATENFKNYQNFDNFLLELRVLNYYFTDTEIFNLEYFGVPQKRKRLAIVLSKLGSINLNREIGKLSVVKDVINNQLDDYKDIFHNENIDYSEDLLERIRLIPKNGGSLSDINRKYWPNPNKEIDKLFSNVYGRMSWDKPSDKLTANFRKPSSGRYLHPEKDRAITCREAMLLQSFPLDYEIEPNISISLLNKTLVNDSCPVFIEKQLMEIKKHLNLYY